MATTLRFLATGDIQCHAWRQFSRTTSRGMNSRLEACLKIFDILLETAGREGISKILLNGDLLEENAYIDVEVYDAVYRRIEELHRNGLEIVINLGNHDVLREAGGRMLHSLRPFRKVSVVVEHPTLVWDRLQVVPWMANPKDLKKAITRLEGSHRFGLALHCGVQGARTGPTAYLARNPIKLRDIRKDDFGLVLLSDYHTAQRLARNVYYLGSPLQHNFGEVHNPGVWDIRLLDESPWFRAKKIYTNMPRFVRATITSRRDLRKQREALLGNYVSVVIPSSASIHEEEIERFARGKFMYIIERESDKTEGVTEDIHTLSPEDAIAHYAGFHSSAGKLERLTRLGQKLYRGEL